MLRIYRKGNYSVSDWCSLSQGHLKISKQWRQVPEHFELILIVLAMIEDDLASRVRNKFNQLQSHLLFHIFFFSIYLLLVLHLVVSHWRIWALKKKKFCTLYSHALFLLRYTFFTDWDKEVADYSVIGTDIMFWYWFIMTCISLRTPPNFFTVLWSTPNSRLPYLLSCFPVITSGPWMSLRKEYCILMVELETCGRVWHKCISSETSPYWVTWGKAEEWKSCMQEKWNLSSHTMEKGPWCVSAGLPSCGRSAEGGRRRPCPGWGWEGKTCALGVWGLGTVPKREQTPKPNRNTPGAAWHVCRCPSQHTSSIHLPSRLCCEFSRPNWRVRGPDCTP